jgi:hypothetical protein
MSDILVMSENLVKRRRSLHLGILGKADTDRTVGVETTQGSDAQIEVTSQATGLAIRSDVDAEHEATALLAFLDGVPLNGSWRTVNCRSTHTSVRTFEHVIERISVGQSPPVRRAAREYKLSQRLRAYRTELT